MINVSEAREDDENFKNPVDLMFDELEQKDPNHFAVGSTKNTSWLPVRQQNLF